LLGRSDLPALTGDAIVGIGANANGDMFMPFGVTATVVVKDQHDVIPATDPDFIATVPSLNRSLAIPGLDRSLAVPGLNRTLQVP
jgi:hypothetical protein